MVRRAHDRTQSTDKLTKGALPRPRGLWQVAVNKTRGLFGQASPQTKLDEQLSHQFLEPPRSCRRSISSPSLKPFRGYDQNDFGAAVPTAFATQSLSANHRKSRLPDLGRPIISSPSFVQHLDKYNFSNPKLSYPLSPMPSPSSSSFGNSSTPFPSSSKLHNTRSVSDDDAAARSVDIVIDRPARRRTKSAPDAKPTKRLAFSPALSTAYEVETISSPSTMLTGVMSVEVNTPPPLESPQATSDYFSRPVDQCTSPRSFISVKRKPVPPYLLAEPPNHNPSTPSTPLISLPTTPQIPQIAPSSSTTSLHAPLLSESELWTSRVCKKDLTLLPIGQGYRQSRPGSSGRTHHRRSISDHVLDLPVAKETPQACANVVHSVSQTVTPEEELEMVFPPKGLSPPPHRSQNANRTPSQSPGERNAQSGDSPVDRVYSRNGALSPLTDEELQAMRSFVRRDGTVYRVRQRRKGIRHVRNFSDMRLSRRSDSYEMHAKIIDSYRDDIYHPQAHQSGVEDVESHPPTSSLLLSAHTAMSEVPEGAEEDHSDCGGSVAGQDEIQTPVDLVNRGTFGYYDAPMVRSCRSRRGCNKVFAYEYIPESEVDGQDWQHVEEDYDEFSEAHDSFDMSDAMKNPESISYAQDLLVKEELPSVTDDVSSLYGGRSSSDFVVYGDEEKLERRQFLVPRTANSDSESDRPVSWYSSSISDGATSSSASESSASSVPIGVAILSPEQLAQLSVYHERSAFSVSSCELEEDLEGTPTTVACSSPVQARLERDFELGDLSSSSDRLQSSLSRMDEVDNLSDRNVLVRPSIVPCVLKPALRIESDASTASSSTEFPSPTETCVSSPPYQAFSPESHTIMTPDWKFPCKNGCSPYCGGGVSSSTDESSVQDSVTSFMHMTPNEPPKKKGSRVRLRQLLSRTNLRLGTGRKGSTGTLKVSN